MIRHQLYYVKHSFSVINLFTYSFTRQFTTKWLAFIYRQSVAHKRYSETNKKRTRHSVTVTVPYAIRYLFKLSSWGAHSLCSTVVGDNNFRDLIFPCNLHAFRPLPISKRSVGTSRCNYFKVNLCEFLFLWGAQYFEGDYTVYGTSLFYTTLCVQCSVLHFVILGVVANNSIAALPLNVGGRYYGAT